MHKGTVSTYSSVGYFSTRYQSFDNFNQTTQVRQIARRWHQISGTSLDVLRVASTTNSLVVLRCAVRTVHSDGLTKGVTDCCLLYTSDAADE